MSAGFRAVQWNQAKLVYDSILLASVVLYISCYLTLVYWLDPPKDLPDGERIAVFRDGAQIGALSNLCAHQNGPIGEGRIIDGCVTCPWHGYQYRLEDGCAPPPFTEKLVAYRVRIARGVVEVDPRPLPPGTSAAMRCE